MQRTDIRAGGLSLLALVAVLPLLAATPAAEPMISILPPVPAE